MIPIFDRQHIGKRSKPGDKGAAWVDGDVVIAHETTLTGWYIHHAARTLAAAGVGSRVFDFSRHPTGQDYSERHRTAIELAAGDWSDHPVPYIACHVNAGGGSYGLVGYDRRSRMGQRLAEALGEELSRLPWLSRVRVEAAEGGWARMRSTIRGIYSGPANIAGVCFEPFFIDHPDHQRGVYADECAAVGDCLARGLLRFAGGEVSA